MYDYLATWLVNESGSVVGLRLPDNMGGCRTLSPMEVVGRFTVEQIADMRFRLSYRVA
jgi:hypothetical protein